jgi:hypothetical protein
LPGGQVVERDDLVDRVGREQRAAQVRTDEPRAPGDHDSH